MTDTRTTFDAMLDRLENVSKPNQNGWYDASCPTHDDDTPSFGLKLSEDGVICIKCHGGCDKPAIVQWFGLKWTDLYPPKPKRDKTPRPNRPKPRVVATYDYADETGKLLYHIDRYEPGFEPGDDKTFRPRCRLANGKWDNHLPKRRVLYHLPDVLAAAPGQVLFLAEGEKSCDAVRSIGPIATCNVTGAGKWDDTYTATLAGKTVCVLTDNDAAGMEHGYTVAEALHGTAASVKVLTLGDGQRRGYDAADWIEDGGDVKALLHLVAEAPEYTSGTPTPPAAAEKQDGWKVWTVADAYKPRPPVEYIVGDLLPLPSLSIIYSPPGGMKTMLLADMAACVAGGKPWLEPLPDKPENTARATKKAAVLWADFDNGPRTMHERIEAAARARNLSPDAPLFYMSMPSPWLDMSDWKSVELLIKRATSLNARLVIIDNLSDVCGSTEENSAAMGTVMSHFRRVSEEIDAAVVVVHHQRKVSGINGRAGDTLRGHSSILAAIDLALCIAREEHSDEITMEATKVRGADVYPFGAVFAYEHKPGTSELASYRFFGTIPSGGKSKPAIRRTILETVKREPNINKSQCVDTVKELHDVGINRVRSQIEYLIGRGKLAVGKGEHNAKILSIPADDPYDSVG